jgi:phosphomevalonate decarboxylase
VTGRHSDQAAEGDNLVKATARAYAIQGLVKYHGLKNKKQRIPYHDSISVCMKSLPTITTVEFSETFKHDKYRINGKAPSKNEQDRIRVVLDSLRNLARRKSLHARVESRNPPVKGKGLGYSSSGFAALGLASATSLGMSFTSRMLSQIVRLGAGSSSRSLVGGFSIWYANRNGLSYAEQLAKENEIPWRSIIVPVESTIKTDKAHEDAVLSPFYKPRLSYLKNLLPKMKTAIIRGDTRQISRLAEVDTLNLHAVTMTGKAGLVLFSPLSIHVMEEVLRLREEDDVPVWFSLDTGPSVFVNTLPHESSKVARRVGKVTDRNVLVSPVGGPAELLEKHLF